MTEFVNAYIALELDPAITDQSVIDATLKRKQGEWSKQANTHPVPEVKRRAQQNLAHLDHYRQRLSDPKLRAQEADQAREHIRQTRESKRQNFELKIQMLSKGKVTDEAVRRLVKEFSRYFYTERDVREALKASTQASAGAPAEDEAETLEPSMMKTIRQNLDTLGIRTLYDFLGVKPGDSLPLIKTKSDDLYTLLKSAALNPENDTRRNLQGYCASILCHEDQRRRYDQSLVRERLEPLLKTMDDACSTGSLEIGHLLLLLKEGARLGLETRHIVSLARARAAKSRVPFNMDESFDFGRPVRCPCGHVNAALEERCAKCRQNLFNPCIKCSKAIAADSLTCSCGFSLQARYDELKAALDQGQEERFLALWDEAYRAHPAFHALAKARDEIPKRLLLRDLQAALESGKEEKFLALWQEQYRREAEFASLARVYDDLHRRKRDEQERREEKRRREEKLKNQFQRLKEALQANDPAAVIQWWDDSLPQALPEVQALLPQIREAHQPRDLEGVRAHHCGGYIQVIWPLSEAVKTYCLAWSEQGFVARPEEGSYRLLTRGEYENRGARIEPPPPGPCHITVFTGTAFMGRKLWSPGTGPGCRAVVESSRCRVQYTVKFKGLLKKDRAVLALKADQRVNRVPDLVLVAKPGKVMPVSPAGCLEVYRLSGLSLAPGAIHEQEIRLPGLHSPVTFRLFSTDPAVELVHPPEIIAL
ncbi:MAG: hypothetical protein C4524_11715 [Candidatus Zixiibacteriota bacterium]|nr:MAG: hypothetical protein C4524_11715 [candidate division Zixibacteria bacterium]